jgi:hypothetical protein
LRVERDETFLRLTKNASRVEYTLYYYIYRLRKFALLQFLRSRGQGARGKRNDKKAKIGNKGTLGRQALMLSSCSLPLAPCSKRKQSF